jgi:hypothetical protein
MQLKKDTFGLTAGIIEAIKYSILDSCTLKYLVHTCINWILGSLLTLEVLVIVEVCGYVRTNHEYSLHRKTAPTHTKLNHR